MTRTTATLAMAVFAVGAFLFPHESSAQAEPVVEYEIIDLGVVGEYAPQPASINDHDQITGSVAGSITQAFLWENGTGIGLWTLGGSESRGFGINNGGQIVGYSRYSTQHYEQHGFLYENGTMTDLGSILSGTGESFARAISDSGLITGDADYWEPGLLLPVPRAFVLDGGSATMIGTLAFDSGQGIFLGSSYGTDINDAGHVTGWSWASFGYNCPCVNCLHCANVDRHAFFYDGNAMIDLGTLGDPLWESQGYAINSNGQVCGWSDTASGYHNAFVTDPDTMEMVNLGTFGGLRSEAYDINDSGHVTGFAQYADGRGEAFLYDGVEVVSLCSLVDCEAEGWTRLRYGYAINNNGSIVGTGWHSDFGYRDRGFLIRAVTDSEGPVSRNVAAAPSVVEVDGTAELTATVDDTETGNSNIDSAEYNIDGVMWFPMDGSWDSPTVDVYALVPAPTTAGVYQVCVRGTDARDNVGEPECTFLVAYDPDGGFVTGGGWIDSPEGAYAPDPTLIGKANFGFVSKYKKGASVPTGNTEFQFKVADLNFKSTSYDWLVIAGSKAKFKGDGTIDGGGNFGFMLSAIDGDKNGGDDTFRIKIWDKDDADTVVYDNQMGDDQDADAATVLGGGAIVVHKAK